jgi:hypothetical protein
MRMLYQSKRSQRRGAPGGGPNRARTLIGVTALFLLVLTASAPAATETVTSSGDSGPGSLRGVIAAAGNGDTIEFDASLEGQTIVLTSGAIGVDKSLTIDGPGASELTIDAGHASQILTVTAGNLSISGLTFVNAAGPENGGAIAQTGTGSLNVSECTFTGNTAGGAGGNADSSNVGHGGAIYASESSGPTFVSDSFFSGNTAGGPGGLGFQSGLGSGGAIWDRGEALTVADSTFIANTAGGGGGDGVQSGLGAGGAIQKAGGLSLTVTGSEFADNTAGGAGGSEESSGRAFGGAIYVSDPDEQKPALAVVDSTFSDNAAGGDGGDGPISGSGEGGAIEHFSEGALTVSGGTFEGNSAGGDGGAGGLGFVFGPPTGSGGGTGGAIFISESTSSTSITESVFTANTAGGNGSTGTLSGRGEGGAVKGDGGIGPVTIVDSTFAENSVGGQSGSGSGSGFGSGGAVDTFSSLTVRDSAFIANAASAQGSQGTGGAITNRNNVSPLTVSGSTFADNVAGGNGGLGYGGAISAWSVSPRVATITNTTLVGNSAGGGGALGHGGAIDVDGAVSATLASVTIDENEVGAGGTGAGISGAGSVTAKATIVSGNTGATNCDVPVASSSYSLEGPSPGNTSCGFDLPSADPMLEPLADNGGPTETQALVASSPAVDAVPAAKCPTKVDQRGEPRPDNGKSVCDVGAFELQDPPVAPAITNVAAATFQVDKPGDFTVTATGLPAPALSATGALPGGVSFVDNGDGTARLSGTPGVGTEGSYPIAIRASNGTAPDAEQSFVLTVQAPPFPPPPPPPPPTHKLMVGLAGDGAGSVTATGGAISCPPACSETFLPGTEVQLTANPAPGSIFAGWSGGCGGVGACQVTLAADTTLAARFERAVPASARLRIRRLRPRVEGRRVKVVVAGTIAKAARGVVRLRVATRVDGRRLRVARRAKIGKGRWRVRLPLAGLDAGDAVTIKAGASFEGSAGVDSARAKRITRFGY